jgi:glutathione peroxidase
MSIHDIEVKTIEGESKSLADFAGKTLLVVNVASKCGMTPQYAGLQTLYDTYKDRGFEVLGFPCNQFGGQEPGTESEIKEFCSLNYNVSFPMFAKIDVNGEGRHPLYQELTKHADHNGRDGDIQWNFEKFLVSPSGDVVARYGPMVSPDKEFVAAAIEEQLPG